jgi:hypothetical protein
MSSVVGWVLSRSEDWLSARVQCSLFVVALWEFSHNFEDAYVIWRYVWRMGEEGTCGGGCGRRLAAGGKPWTGS